MAATVSGPDYSKMLSEYYSGQSRAAVAQEEGDYKEGILTAASVVCTVVS